LADKPDVPPAVVVQDGKVPGDVPGSAPPAPAPRGRRHRKLANYLLDKRLQLRYVLAVTLVSAMIAGVLGYLIYRQEHQASGQLSADMTAQFAGEGDAFAEDLDTRDRSLVFEMIAIGLGLTVILSGYLVVMTHKVVGPLYKVGLYFDQMAAGRLGPITPLRKGDMLQDFYREFGDAHAATRQRLTTDVEVLARFVDAWAAAGGEPAAVAAARAHVDERRRALG
jgi:hypothetical protein